MTFLPIVERELRVAARRPGTYRTRWFAALGMMAVCLLLLATNRGASTAQLSKILFIALGVLALGFCLVAGILLTADCLSEEKREGTLGLLFLTDLRGYDVVLGKLIATSVHAAYALLAMFPVLALPLMLGGVTASEFWRVVLALAATLWLSLSLGMAVSAIARDTRQAMAGTFLGMFVLAGILPAFWWLGYAGSNSSPPGILLWPSPVNAFTTALDSSYRSFNGPHEFWGSLLTISCLSLGLLASAAFWLPRAWQEKAAGGETHQREGEGSAYELPRLARPSLSLEGNPYLWLAGCIRPFDPAAGVLLGLLVLIWCCCLAASVLVRHNELAFIICLFSAYAIHQAGKYLVAVEATRQFAEDQRSGALELLLVTPLGEAQILAGHEQALQRRSQRLKVLLLLVNACMCFVVLACPRILHMSHRDQTIFIGIFLGGIVTLFVDCWALETLGTWLALRASRQHRAVLGTLGRVLLVPWALIFLWVFLSITGGFRSSGDDMTTLTVLWFAAGIVTDVVVCATARERLSRGLRYWIAEGGTASGRDRLQAPGPLNPFQAAELPPREGTQQEEL